MGALTGRTISHYRVLDPLGRGGMGEVYRAQDLRLGRAVALKFLPLEFSHQDGARERFLREARAASTLDHPNICTIYEVDMTPEGQLFLAMACYQGESLKSRLSRGRLTVPQAVEIVRQTARGLGESHGCGIIHRDIKPANIWLTQEGTVKILDFGLAKIQGQNDLTRSGSSLGTPSYMSPEHIEGREIDGRTDLWSLGVLLYEMLAGTPPFPGDNIATILHRILHREPTPLRSLRLDVPPSVEAVVAGLLEKARSQRYPSCDVLLAALDRLPAVSAEPLARPSATIDDSEEPTQPVRNTAPPTAAAATIDSHSAEPEADGLTFETHLSHGLERALARDYTAAAEAFEQALALRPDDSRVRFNLEKVRRRLSGDGAYASGQPASWQATRPPARS